MKTLLSVVFVLLVVGLVIATATIVINWYDELGDNDVRLPFRSFRKFYDIAPEKYRCRSTYIWYQFDRSTSYPIVMKTPIDLAWYILWMRGKERRASVVKGTKVTQSYLDCVRKDIENYTGGDTESNS